MKAAKADFDRVAPFYNFLSLIFFANVIRRSQKDLIKKLSKPDSILIVGGGTGKFLKDISQSFPDAKIDYVDSSLKMIQKSQKEVSSNITFHHRNIFDFKPDKYDLICTMCFLDCLNDKELDELFELLTPSLNDNAQWLFNDFHIHNKSAAHHLSIKALYRFFKTTAKLENDSLPDFESKFKKFNFEQKHSKFRLCKLLVSRIYDKI